VKPKCHHCKRKGEDVCQYDTVLRRRGPGKKNKRKKDDEDSSSGIEDPSEESIKMYASEKHSIPVAGMSHGVEVGAGNEQYKMNVGDDTGISEYRGRMSLDKESIGGLGYGSRFETSTARV